MNASSSGGNNNRQGGVFQTVLRNFGAALTISPRRLGSSIDNSHGDSNGYVLTLRISPSFFIRLAFLLASVSLYVGFYFIENGDGMERTLLTFAPDTPRPPLIPIMRLNHEQQPDHLMLREFPKQKEKIPDSLPVTCLRLSGFTPVGGIESWLSGLVHQNAARGNYHLLLAGLVAPSWIHAWLYGSRSLIHVLDQGVDIVSSDLELETRCDIIITTGVQPIARNTRNVPSVLVIHGGKDQWTHRYADFMSYYDAVVCVSLGCKETYEQLARQHNIPLLIIPSCIDIPKYRDRSLEPFEWRRIFSSSLLASSSSHKNNQERDDSQKSSLLLSTNENDNKTRILGFLGRISGDKNPQYFIDTVSFLSPTSWYGVMAGPAYYSQDLERVPESRFKLVGNVEPDDVPKFMSSVDCILLPSPSEGGPIVLLEAWASGVPFFMFPTGLAVAHPNCVHLLQVGWTPKETAAFIEDVMSNPKLIEEKRQCGYKVVEERFSAPVTGKAWGDLLKALVQERRETQNIRTFTCMRWPQTYDGDQAIEPYYSYDHHVEWQGTSCALVCIADSCHFHVGVDAFEGSGNENALVTSQGLLVFYECKLWDHKAVGNVTIRLLLEGEDTEGRVGNDDKNRDSIADKLLRIRGKWKSKGSMDSEKTKDKDAGGSIILPCSQPFEHTFLPFSNDEAREQMKAGGLITLSLDRGSIIRIIEIQDISDN